MALRNVITLPDETLAKKSREVTAFDDRLWVLLDDMYETLQTNNGVGMAAVQVGILRRAIVIEIEDEYVELVNPEILQSSGKQREIEGCLSNPDIWGYVERPTYVKVKYQNRHGKDQTIEADELLAIAICHEMDHLDGIMFNDIADEMVDEPPTEDEKRRRGRGKKRKRR
ncbi:MAG: peptide deformylase [Oscillospiraceae bacterium]|nr:peptide deformylase [Oscillospiraceae bacterium]